MVCQIEVPQDKIAGFCRRHSILRLALFGSVLGDEFGSDSDIDVLVDFEPDRVPGFFGLARLERELSELLDRRKVDIRTPQDLSPYFREQVVASSEVQYVAG